MSSHGRNASTAREGMDKGQRGKVDSKMFCAFCQNIKSRVSREKFLVGNERGEELNSMFVQVSGMFLLLSERIIP